MNALEVDLNLFKVLAVLFEEGSVSKAATRLKVSQPAVSAALRRLREQFDDELFIRSGGGLVPTRFAESLQEPVRRTMELIDNEVLFARSFDPASARMTFRISTSDLGEAILLPPLHALLKKMAPNCTLQCVSLPPELMKRAMIQGEIDLAIGYFPDLAMNGIHEQFLSHLPLAGQVREGHPLAGKSIDSKTFQALGHAVVGHETRRLDAYEKFIEQQGIERDIRVELANMTSLPPLLASTDLIAVAPNITGQYSGLSKVDLPFEPPSIEAKIYWHHRAHADAAIMWLKRQIMDSQIGVSGFA